MTTDTARRDGVARADGDGRPRLLVVEPDPLAGPDRFADWLAAAGLALRVVRPHAGEPLPAGLDEDGLLVLGGGMSAWDDAEHPWLADVRRLLRDAVGHSRPALGVCLGAQLLALACGGTVARGARGLEAGVALVRWLPAARTDALCAGLPAPFPAAALHQDAVGALPPGAVWLGYGETYPHQAFRVGSSAWGVQFHPEVSLAGYRAWVAADGGADPVAHGRMRRGAADLERVDGEVAAAGRLLASRFAGVVHAAAVRSR